MDTEDLRLANVGGDSEGDDVSLDNLPQKVRSHRSVGKNMVFSTPPTYNSGRFSSTGKQSRLSSVAKQSTPIDKRKSPLPENKDTPEVVDPETGTKKKLENNFVGVSSGKSLKTCLCITITVFLSLVFIAFVVYTIIKLESENCPENYVCWGEKE